MNRNDDKIINNNQQQHQNKSTLLSSYLASDDDDDNDDDIFDNNNKNDNCQNNERLEILTTTTTTSTLNNNSSNNRIINNNNNNRIININNENENNENYLNSWNDNLIESITPRRSQYRIIFEIIKARTITQNNETRQKFVNYTILIKRIPGLEIEPAIIERRYTEFRNFYLAIKKKYPSLLKDVIFPKKIFIGNFSAEVIAERSLLFQKFLTYCLSISEIRLSKEFAQFLYYPELKEVKNFLRSIRLEEAANQLENIYYIQCKLSLNNGGRPDAQLIHTLCCLIGCLNAVDNQIDAKKFSQKTFDLLFENPIVLSSPPNNNGNNEIYQVNHLFESSPLIIPLILLSLRHEWFYGQKKLLLEKKLEELCRKQSLPRNYDTHPKLLEIILRKDFKTIL